AGEASARAWARVRTVEAVEWVEPAGAGCAEAAEAAGPAASARPSAAASTPRRTDLVSRTMWAPSGSDGSWRVLCFSAEHGFTLAQARAAVEPPEAKSGAVRGRGTYHALHDRSELGVARVDR